MKQQTFTRPTTDSLLVINCEIDTHDLALALDTGASYTTIDLAALIIAGYDITKAERITQIETASGVIETHMFSKLKH